MRRCGQKVGQDAAGKNCPMYSEEQYSKALEVYMETDSITKTITVLGYPKCRQTLYNWISSIIA